MLDYGSSIRHPVGGTGNPGIVASKKQEPLKAMISIINPTSSIGETKNDT